MAVRLSELLERIRPAGTPGSAAGAESNVERALADEIAPLVAVLRRFDDDADSVIAAAGARADTIRSEGEQRAARIRSGAAERVAVATASGNKSDREQADAERQRIMDAAEAEVERRRVTAEAAREQLAERVLDIIRELADAPDGAT